MKAPLIVFLLFLTVTGSPAVGEESSSSARRPRLPNIILVMSDDQGWGDVGYNGHPVLKTPNLDAAAAAGLRFDFFYAAAPSCSPTRASVLTGRHPNRMGVFSWGHSIRPQEITLAEILRQHGYVTGHFGKWHLGSVRADSPVNPGKNGFDRWFSAPNYFDNNPVMSDEGHEVKIDGESSEIAVEAALEWIEDRAAGEAPIFAVIWFGSPHYPHRAAPEDRALYEDQPRKQREFLGEVTGIDRAFGRLRDGIREFGVQEQTLLWYTSDNGALPKVGSSGGYRGGKHSVFEGGLRVPALIEWPAMIPEPRATGIRCSTVDILPTVLDIVGADETQLPILDGISLLPVLKGEVETRDRPLGFWNANIPGRFTNPLGPVSKVLPTFEDWSDRKVDRVTRRVEKVPRQKFPENVYPGHAAWISGKWKLHRFSMSEGQRVRWALYDLASDPGEEMDLSEDRTEVVDELRPELESWLKSVVGSLNGQDYVN